MAHRGRGKGKGRAAGNASTGYTAAMQIDPSTANQPRKTQTQKRLPTQYQITPPNPEAPISNQSTPPVPLFQPPIDLGVRSYPPPLILFNNSRSHSGASLSSAGQPSASPQPQPSRSPHRGPSASSQPRRADSYQPRLSAALQPLTAASSQPRVSASNHRHSPPNSSQAQNDLDEEDEEDYDEVGLHEVAGPEPTLSEDLVAALNNLLTQPGREQYTTRLSPTLEPGTTW